MSDDNALSFVCDKMVTKSRGYVYGIWEHKMSSVSYCKVEKNICEEKTVKFG